MKGNLIKHKLGIFVGETGNQEGGREELLFGKPRRRGSIKSCSKRDEVVRPLDEQGFFFLANKIDRDFQNRRKEIAQR